MSIATSYNIWSNSYDTNSNKTRDLDFVATTTVLQNVPFKTVLEMGCGTGKNTLWLLEKAEHVFAFDFSEGMLSKARSKITASNVTFIQADIIQPWQIENNFADLVTFNLVLEHVQHLEIVLQEAYEKLKPGGKVFICELHPFKQYTGSKARFETEMGLEILETYTHHISEYLDIAFQQSFRLLSFKEWFDESEEAQLPRLLSLLLEK
jgi:ubiquinone/menaquinone biosynthesis C-methylase UbiE